MNVCNMKAGERASVYKVSLDEKTRERLRYLNVSEGALIYLLKVSFFRKTYFLQARSAKIAVSREIAEKILVGSVRK